MQINKIRIKVLFFAVILLEIMGAHVQCFKCVYLHKETMEHKP